MFKEEVTFMSRNPPISQETAVSMARVFIVPEDLGTPPGAISLRGATNFQTPAGWDTVYTPIFNMIERPVAPMLVVRVETDWYPHETEFRYVLQPGEGIPGAHHIPIGQVFFVPREEMTLRDCSDDELAAIRQAKEEFFREKAALEGHDPLRTASQPALSPPEPLAEDLILWRVRLGDHPFDAIDVAGAQRACAVGGDALRQRHAAPAGAAGGVCRLERGPLLLRVEIGEIDDAEILIAVSDARHLGDAVDNQRHSARRDDPRHQFRGSPRLPSLRPRMLFRLWLHRVHLIRLTADRDPTAPDAKRQRG